MMECSGSSPPAVPSAVVRMAAGALPAEAVALVAGYAGQALSENTKRAYASD